jgi:NAD(P)H-nitrite reductase large subunit
MKGKDFICQCFNLYMDELQTFIRVHHLIKYSRVEELTYAGSACGYCIPQIIQLMVQENDHQKQA